jgi:hypothetical protein
MELGNAVLIKINQMQKDKYHMSSLICGCLEISQLVFMTVITKG